MPRRKPIKPDNGFVRQTGTDSPFTPPITDLDRTIMAKDGSTGRTQGVGAMARLVQSHALHINRNYQCAEFTSMTQLKLKPDAKVDSYRKLVRWLAKNFDDAKSLETLLKFWIGDLLISGEDLFGEEAACVFGKELSGKNWQRSYVENIMSVCRSIPPSERRLSLNWSMHRELAPRWVKPEDRVLMMDKALEMFQDPERRDHYVRETTHALHEKYCKEHVEETVHGADHRELWAGKDQESAEWWYDYIEKNAGIRFPALKKQMAGEEPLFGRKHGAVEWLRDYVLTNSDSQEVTDFCMRMTEAMALRIQQKAIRLKPENFSR